MSIDMSGVTIVVVEDSLTFAALEGEWDDLYHCCARVTPFQSWAWLYSWWEHYGESYELRLVTMRNDEGLLIGILPLMLERKAGFGRLLWVGTGLSDYLDMLVRERWEEQVAEAAVRAVAGIRSWSVADLQLLRPDAAVWGMCSQWYGHRACVWQDGCPVIEVKPWDELLTSLSKNLRSTVRRSVRRAAEDGLYSKIVDATDTKQAAQRLVALHKEAWQERNIGPEHLSQRFEDFIVAAADRMAARRLAIISEFRQGEEVLISDLIMFGRDFCGTYILGASQTALQRYQWSSLYIQDAVQIAHNENRSYLDLLRGEESYKLRWSSRVISTRRLILGPHWATWMPYAGYHTLRSKAKLYARSESAPGWLKSATGKYRTLRRRVKRSVKKVSGQI